MPSGEGLSFFRFSTALVTIPFFGPSFAGRSNRTTGTLHVDQVRRDLRAHDAGAEDGDLADVETLCWHASSGVHSARIQVWVRPRIGMPM